MNQFVLWVAEWRDQYEWLSQLQHNLLWPFHFRITISASIVILFSCIHNFLNSWVSFICPSPCDIFHWNQVKVIRKGHTRNLWTCHSLSRVKNLFLLYVNFTFIIYRKHAIGFPSTLMSSTSSLWFLHAAFQILWLVDLWIHLKQLYYLGQATRCSFSDKHANELLFTVFCKAIYVYI